MGHCPITLTDTILGVNLPQLCQLCCMTTMIHAVFGKVFLRLVLVGWYWECPFVFLNSNLLIPCWLGREKKEDQGCGGRSFVNVNFYVQKRGKKAKEIPVVVQLIFKSFLCFFFPQLWSKQYWFTCIWSSRVEKKEISSSLISHVKGNVQFIAKKVVGFSKCWW